MTTAKVFISHSSADRNIAVMLDGILRKHEAETFLDHESVEAGDILPHRLRERIDWCNRFLLVWSIHAARSTWVLEQWDQAYGQRKIIFPYVLDDCPLPHVLEDHLLIKAADTWHAHGELLSVIFRENLEPAHPSQLFVGTWRATLAIDGLAEATHNLVLRADGEITGEGIMGQSGKFASLVREMGMSHFLNVQFPLRGMWRYEEISQELVMDITAEGLGMSKREVIHVAPTGKDDEPATGEDEVGRTWIVERLS